MNNSKRTFNPLLGKIFNYQQSENASLKYQGNWGHVINQALSDSTWTVESGDAVLSGASFVTSGSGTTAVNISGTPGRSVIVNKITMADGQIDERTIKLKIVDNDIPVYNYDYGMGGDC